ncbi:MAG TPA: thermonuclease family protein [Hyphomicrobiaceae bacterium]|nr:thermonuclease family protein [Hyphomicrobiaceae bacterium]
MCHLAGEEDVTAMLAWRRKTEGFEWHQYIRTAVRQRRQQRHDRMVQARRAAGQQVQAAGVALVAGSLAAGVAAKEGAKASVGAAGLLAGGLFSMLVALGKIAGQAIEIAARPLIAALARPAIGAPVAFAGGLILGAGLGRARVLGLDGEGYLTLCIAGLLLLASLPLLSALTGLRLPRFAGTALSPAAIVVGIVLLAAAGAAAWYAKGGRLAVPNIAANLPLIGGTRPLEGRAYAVGGDSLHIGGTTVRLSGIEAPEQEQRCGTGNRRWRCGAAASEALSRLVNGRIVSCTLAGNDNKGRPLASCMAGKTEINAELVRRGHVFAETGLFARYASLENEARTAKAGLWAGGDVERPSDYRARQKRPGV